MTIQEARAAELDVIHNTGQNLRRHVVIVQ